MDTPIFRGNVRLGTGVGDYLRQRIRRAKHSIYVLSPYLSQSLVADLVAAQKRGVQVHLLTSDSETTCGALQQKDLFRSILRQRLVKDERKAQIKLAATLVSAGIFIATLVAAILYTYAFLFAAVVAAIVFALFSRWRVAYATYDPLLATFIVFCSQEGLLPAVSEQAKKLIHAKVYVIDGKIAYLGSLNLTYRGFHDNYESLIEVSDESAVKAIIGELETLPKSKEYAQADLDALGNWLYKVK